MLVLIQNLVFVLLTAGHCLNKVLLAFLWLQSGGPWVGSKSRVNSRYIRAFPVAPIRWNSHNIDSSYMFLHKPVTSNTVAVSWGAGASNRGARSELSLGATCELLSTSQNLGSRSISNLVKMLIGQFPTPLRSGSLYSNLENWELGPILTHLKPGRSNSNILEVVTELHLIFSNTL